MRLNNVILVKNKPFLLSIYKASPKTIDHMLNVTTDYELKLLYHILHFIVKGKIPINNSDFDAVTKKKKISFLKKNFETKIKEPVSRKELLPLIKKMKSALPILLRPLLEK